MDTCRDSGELASQSDPDHASEGDLLLTAQLLGLFLSLLGAAVTLQLVQDVFPNLTVTTEAGTITPFEDILKEVDQLNSVSDRLESLADQNPFVEEALLSVSGNVRNTATTLEVLALIKTKAEEPKKSAEAKTGAIFDVSRAIAPLVLAEGPEARAAVMDLLAPILTGAATESLRIQVSSFRQ